MSGSSSSRPSSPQSPTSTLSALTKIPLFFSHWKYLSPLTLPSFLPVGSSSAMPIHGAPDRPGRDGIGPTKATEPRRVVSSASLQRAPALTPEEGIRGYPGYPGTGTYFSARPHSTSPGLCVPECPVLRGRSDQSCGFSCTQGRFPEVSRRWLRA